MYGYVPPLPTAHDAWSLEGAYTHEDRDAAPGDADFVEEKRALLLSCRYDPPRAFEVSYHRLDPALVCALRLNYLTREQLDGCCGGNWNRVLAHAPVSAENELVVARALRKRLAALLTHGGASLADDREALASCRLPPDGGVREVRQLLVNCKAVVASCVEIIDDFVVAAEAVAEESDAQPANLLDAFSDYMPKMRVL